MPLALILAALLALVAPRASAAEVQLWHAYRGAEREALDLAVVAWNEAHPDEPVVSMAIPNEAYQARLDTAIPRGNGPDLFIASAEKVVTWSRSGLIQRADPEVAAFHPVTAESLRVEEATWGWPLAFKCLALYVNPALVAEVPPTAEALLEFARGQRAADRWGLAFNVTETYYVVPWLNGFGGGVFRDGAVHLDSPENARALAFVKALGEEGPADPTTALVTQLFNEGRVAMVVDGPWLAGELRPDLDYRIVPLPTVAATGAPAAPYATVEALFLAGGARNPEAARAFARFLAEDQAVLRARTGRQSVAALAAWEDPAVAGDGFLTAFRAQLDRAVPMPTDPAMAQIWEPMNRAVRRVNRGATPPENAVREAQTAFAVVTAPPPPAASPLPFVVVAATLSLAGAGWTVRRARGVRLRPWSHAYAWVGPAFVAMGLLVVLPFLVGSAMSLFAHRNGEWTFVGLANFLNILLARDWPVTSPLSFYYTLLVTLTWTVTNVFLHVTIGMALAFILREPWVRLRALWRVLLIVPWAVPNYITALMWKGMFHRQLGAINAILGMLGLEPVGWYDRFLTAFAANLTTNTWLGFPFMMVVTLGALQAIPRDLEEAAMLDGAGPWARFRHVLLPLLKPALLPAVILGSVWTFNQFNIIYLVSGGEPDGSTEILISEAYRWAFTRDYRFGYAAAYAVLVFLILLAYGRFTNRLKARAT